jgi:membrane protease YdiL (CAAX protease family)
LKYLFKNKDSKVRSGWKIFFMFLATMSLGNLIYIFLNIFPVKLVESNTIALLEQSLVTFFSFGIFTLVIWLFVEKKTIDNIGLVIKKKSLLQFFLGFFIGIISISFITLILLLKKDIILEFSFNNIKSNILTFFLLFLVFVMVGLGEEIFFRGYLIGILKQTGNKHIVLYVSSFLFSLAHFLNPNINLIGAINIVLVGVLFVVVTLKTKTLWISIGYHITWNYFQGVVFGFEVSGLGTESILKSTIKNDNIFNGGSFGLEGGILTTFVIFVTLIIFNFVYKEKITI